MRKTRIRWSDRAKSDLRELRERIATGAPRTAREYLRRLKGSTARLRIFPQSGWVVEEINDPTILEIVFDRYRIIYHYDGKFVDIVRVWPGARPLTLQRLERQ